MFGYRKNTFSTVINFFILLYSCVSDPINIDSVLVLSNGIYYNKISNKPQTGEVFSNYNNQRVVFGLGKEEKLKTVEILWPGGDKKETFKDLDSNFYYKVLEGISISIAQGKY